MASQHILELRPTRAVPVPALDPAPDFVDYPSILPTVYALRVSGDGMASEIPNGALVVVDRTVPPIAGEFVAIYRTREATSQGEPQAIVRRLALAPHPSAIYPENREGFDGFASAILLSQENPRRLIVISGRDVLALHRCVGPAAAEEAYDVAPLATVGA